MTRTAEEGRTWTVRELADELGVTTRTLRFYEAEGLLSPERLGSSGGQEQRLESKRTQGRGHGQRVYGQRDHARLRLILRGRRFGMTLGECREIVDMYDGAASSERRQLETLLARLDEISIDLRARQADLRRTLGEVSEVAGRCRERLAELS